MIQAPPSLAPVLETERLRLRGLRLADFEAFAAFYASPRSHFVGGPCSRQDAWRKFQAFAGMWALRGYGMWVIEAKATGDVIGRCGVQFHDHVPEPEFAWVIFDGHEGRGYATEAMQAARAHVFGPMGMESAICLIDPKNAASEALARRLGAWPEGDFTYPDGHEVRIWRMPAADPASALRPNAAETA